MRIALFGDINGGWEQLHGLATWAQRDYGCSVGIQTGGYLFGEFLPAHHPRLPMPIIAIGCHRDDWQWLVAEGSHRQQQVAWRNNLNLCYAPRGFAADLGGRRFGFVGGGVHPNMPQLGCFAGNGSPRSSAAAYNGIIGHVLRQQDVDACVTAWNAQPVDVVVSSDAPAITATAGSPTTAFQDQADAFVLPFGLTSADGASNLALGDLYGRLHQKPGLWVIGSGRTDRSRSSRDGCTFMAVGRCTPAAGAPPSFDILDTSSLSIERVRARPEFLVSPTPSVAAAAFCNNCAAYARLERYVGRMLQAQQMDAPLCQAYYTVVGSLCVVGTSRVTGTPMYLPRDRAPDLRPFIALLNTGKGYFVAGWEDVLSRSVTLLAKGSAYMPVPPGHAADILQMFADGFATTEPAAASAAAA